MKKILVLLVTSMLAIAPANAVVCEWCKPPPKVVPKPSPGIHPSTTGLWFAGGIIGCQVGSLMIGAAIKGHREHRELTLGEAHALFWGCAVPIVGYFIAQEAFRMHPEWNNLSTAPAPIR